LPVSVWGVRDPNFFFFVGARCLKCSLSLVGDSLTSSLNLRLLVPAATLHHIYIYIFHTQVSWTVHHLPLIYLYISLCSIHIGSLSLVGESLSLVGRCLKWSLSLVGGSLKWSLTLVGDSLHWSLSLVGSSLNWSLSPVGEPAQLESREIRRKFLSPTKCVLFVWEVAQFLYGENWARRQPHIKKFPQPTFYPALCLRATFRPKTSR